MLGLIEKKIRYQLRTKGLAETAKWLASAGLVYCRHFPVHVEQLLADRLFDLWNGVDTYGTINQDELEFGECASASHSNRYVAIVPRMFYRMIASLPIQYRDFTFVDIGSGKGRALLMAAKWPFRRILGVELSPKLHLIAQRNIAVYKHRRLACRNIRSLCCDAAVYPIPDTRLVLYLYNPFKETVMLQVLSNLQASLDERPREIYLLYRTPVFNDLLLGSGFFERIQSNDHFSIYRAASRAGRVMVA